MNQKRKEFAIALKTFIVKGQECFTKDKKYKVVFNDYPRLLILINNFKMRHTVTGASDGWFEYFTLTPTTLCEN